MVTLQIINKIIMSGKIDIILNNGLEEDHFIGYEEEFNFILKHYNKHNKVPDKETFLDNYKDFDFVNVKETDEYLLDTLFEEHLYYRSVSIIQEVAELLKTDANEAVDYLHSKISQLQIPQLLEGIDIIAKAKERLDLYNDKKNNYENYFIKSGFDELDGIIEGWSKGEELVVFLARTGHGKSWLLTKSLMSAWKDGNRVGYISPEMSPIKLGYRFDTLFKNFSNTKLVRGLGETEYPDYIDKLKNYQTPFIVATPKDFGKKIFVSKLKNFCIMNKLDILGIDGIAYLKDERYKRGDNKTISLTNISEDLMDLSIEIGIPIIVVVQSNRGGVTDNDNEETPELENIKDSDGIAHNASKVISIKQTGGALRMDIKKHRDGESEGHLFYLWNIDLGTFKYIPSNDDFTPTQEKDKQIQKTRSEFKDNTEAF